MNVTLEKLEAGQVKLRMEVEAAQVDVAIGKAVKKVVRQVIIPGFRPGKAPRTVLERYVGRDYLMNEALEQLFPEVYRDALSQTGVEPIDQPSLEPVTLQDHEAVILVATVMVKPEVKLGDYTDVSVPKETVEITESDVEESILALRQQMADFQSVPEVTGTARVVADVRLVNPDGEMVEDLPGTELDLGNGSLIPAVAEALVGAKVGEERVVDYPVAQEGIVLKSHMNVTKIEDRVLPVLDESFLQKVGNFSNEQELREQMENVLRNQAERQAEEARIQAVLHEVVGRSEVDVPEALVEKEIDAMVNELGQELGRQFIDLNEYIRVKYENTEAFRNELREGARNRAKTNLVIEAIAEAEGLRVTQRELETALTSMAAENPKLINKKKGVDQNIVYALADYMLREKVLRHLTKPKEQEVASTTEKGEGESS